MSPDQFAAHLKKQGAAPVYLFLGPEAFQRGMARRALLDAALPPESREEGLARFDLSQTPFEAVLDDARSLSLFTRERVIWVANAEAALPRTRASAEVEESETAPKGQSAEELAAYIARPTPGVVVVFEASRFDFSGDDKAKLERVQKFYAAIPNQVEFRPYTIESARFLAQDLAKQAGLQIGTAQMGLLVEATGGDAARLAVEIEKLSLYTGSGRAVTAEDIARLVANAQVTSIFALVAALGRKDRVRSLDLLATLVRDGEYLPLALTFLATQFRLALVASEGGLRNTGQIQAHCARQGIRMWRERAEQVLQTVNLFERRKLELALMKIGWADRALRDTRPDDRVIIEELILELTTG